MGYTWFEISTAIAATIVTAAMLWICYAAAENAQERAINVLVGFFGLAGGWLAGIVLAPFTPAEGAQFAVYAGAVSAFVTGYAAGKTDDLVKYVLSPQNLTRRRAFHAVLFLVTFLVALIVVFEFRFYHTQEVAKPQQSGPSTAAPPPTTATPPPTGTPAQR
jgi:hypothetical protein